MNELYPLKFKPIFKEKVWGGEKIRTHLGLDFSPLRNCGEAWVLSGVEQENTVVLDGWLKDNELNELVEVYMDDLVGEKVFKRYGTRFPILIKFIDSHEYLSVQVHPNDELARKRGLANGKSEMWYILQADEGAELISGFNRKMDVTTYLKHLEAKKLPDILNIEKVHAEDVFEIPAGRIHALGPGVLLAEIQQTSDITYRIYDWDRVDENGHGRELHTDLAMEAVNFRHAHAYQTDYLKKLNQSVDLVNSEHFATRLLHFDHPVEKDLSEMNSFVIYLCTEGAAKLAYPGGSASLKKGEVILVPACIDRLVLNPEVSSKFLEVYIP
ncbi:MAG: mannose-6-phosphate isomerase [Bacteroidetes bacterium]|nr:mannose-6-phosphate isomerase [Bacteroidota bacterium]